LVSFAAGGRLPCLLSDTKHAGEYADHPAMAPPNTPPTRSGGLVAGFRALLNALNQSLRIQRRRCAEKRDDNGPKRECAIPTAHALSMSG